MPYLHEPTGARRALKHSKALAFFGLTPADSAEIKPQTEADRLTLLFDISGIDGSNQQTQNPQHPARHSGV